MSDTLVELVETRPDDALFDPWCDVWAAAQLEDRPDERPPPSSEHIALGRRLLAPDGSRAGTHRAAVLDGAVVGALRLVVPVRDNPTGAVVDVAVHPRQRRRGIGSVLLAEAVRLARAHGRTGLIAEVDEPGPGTPGRHFARRHGWTCDLLETRRHLVLPLDERRLAAVEAEARRASTAYELVTWRERTPEELLDDRALLERRMTTDAPHGDLPVEEEDWDGARIREYEQGHAERGRTVLSAGAVRDGRRLGSLVKAAVLRQVLDGFPQVRTISTYNADSNRPMVAVNEALGFVRSGSLSSWSLRL